MKHRNAFWFFPLATGWRTYCGRKGLARVGTFARFARELFVRRQSANASPLVNSDVSDDEKLTIIVFNQKRPQHVGQMAQYVRASGYLTNHLNPPQLFRDLGGGRFEDVTASWFQSEFPET